MAGIDSTLLWLQTTLLGGTLYWISFFYISLYRGRLDLVGMSEAWALSGGILLGLSFALSGLSFFFDVFDTKLKYRKMLGIVGYCFALAYAITLVLRDPVRYWSNFLTTATEAEAVLGLSAMAILTLMVLISGQWAVRRFTTWWRPLLRLGYVAYLLLILRAVLLEGEVWQSWVSTLSTVPPPRLLLTLFALCVIALRIALEIGVRVKLKSAVQKANP